MKANVIQIVLIAVMMFSLVVLAVHQLGKDEGYRPTRDQILHICETLPQDEMPACLAAADRARN